MDEIKKLQNRINQLESEMDGLDDDREIEHYAEEIYRLEKQIERLKLKKEDIEKYATEEEKKHLKEAHPLNFHTTGGYAYLLYDFEGTDAGVILGIFSSFAKAYAAIDDIDDLPEWSVEIRKFKIDEINRSGEMVTK
jgi:DNA repair exonuclease SbcCD ATPase subunit